MVLTASSYTRVTLALDIVRKISDGPYRGYHELGTVKHRIDLCDTVCIEEARTDTLECDDPAVPCDDRNVCLKVTRLVQQQFGIDRHVRIGLTKRIPVMGGLAGGSANAATTLQLLNELWELRLPTGRMVELARNIGMDVPYYFIGNTAYDTEAGLVVEPIVTGCSFVFVLACPDFGVSTADAYAGVDYAAVGRNLALTDTLRRSLEAGDAEGAPRSMHNDFESTVFSRFPRLSTIKKDLLEAGCRAALLTGSGSTVIGVVRNAQEAKTIAGKMRCRTIIASTKEERICF
jgi:4-diphosphocytidyl-2-C-methyl-D-erythritol kinase